MFWTSTYDRRGRPATVTQNGIQDTLSYNDADLLLSESYSSGLLANLSVTSGYDQYLRRSSLVLNNQQSTLQTINHGYDNASRFQTVTDNTGSPAYSATYSYLANSPLISNIVFKQSSTTRMSTTNQWDYLNRLLGVSSAPSAASALNFGYSYNNANQRTRSTLADNSYWSYTYDSLGQVTTGQKYWSDQTPVAGQQFDYTFDTIGNRTSSKAGGDQNGANQRTANYGANSLNQYTNRDVPAAFDVTGVAFATNTVTVNSQTAYRKGEYFRSEVPVSNGSTSVWQSVTVAATNQATVSGNVYVPKSQEQFSYDLDGNLTNDGRWAYTWDAENRLVKLAPNTSIGPRNSLQFEYDWQGRRIHKQVWATTNWSGTLTSNVKFVYDGWNLLAELNITNNTLIRSFMWGSDLSGTIQGAGGVGGLLEVVYKGAQATNCFVASDGNGNVAGLADAATTNALAQYEYGPFGELIRATGTMAKANPSRFSTKYQDDEMDLLYYGYRYYHASTGRWLSRDPMDEPSFLSQMTHTPFTGEPSHERGYVFIHNQSLSYIDLLGLDTMLIIQGEEWEHQSSMFRRASIFTANLYKSSHGFNPACDAVLVLNLSGTRDRAASLVEAALQKMRGIRYIVYIGHSAENFLFLTGDQDPGSNLGLLDVSVAERDPDQPFKAYVSTSITHLSNANLTQHAFAVIAGCRAGRGIAPGLSRVLGKPVLATPSYVNFTDRGEAFVRWPRALFVGGWKWYGGTPLGRSVTGRDAAWSQAEADQVQQQLNATLVTP